MTIHRSNFSCSRPQQEETDLLSPNLSTSKITNNFQIFEKPGKDPRTGHRSLKTGHRSLKTGHRSLKTGHISLKTIKLNQIKSN